MEASSTTNPTSVLAAGLVAVLALAGCGDGNEAGDEQTAAPATATEAAEATEAAQPAAETVTITARNYTFEGVPESVEAGTTIEIDNQSEDEAHEVLAFKLPDDEDRPVQEIVSLPPEQFQQVGAQLAGVTLAPPGGSSGQGPAPPLTLTEPGRYALVCFLPTGAPPDEVLQAAREFLEAGAPEGEKPDYPETGPPHASHGMFAELTVTAAS